MSSSLLQTPKQSPSANQRDWYPYYAGFRRVFVEDILRRHGVDATMVLDPWNGSGTTTDVAGLLGKQCVGFDVNPALTVIARARLTPSRIASSLPSLADEIVARACRERSPLHAGDPLTRWFKPRAAEHIRGISASIRTILGGEYDVPMKSPTEADSVPVLGAFFITALFMVVRDLTKPFRASNPTWVRDPASPSARRAPHASTVHERFRDAATLLVNRLAADHDRYGISVDIRTADSRHIPLESATIDLCVTSPPYCTRIDYVRATLPELAVLGIEERIISRLRACSVGSPVILRDEANNVQLGEYTTRLLKRVSEHPSVGSTRYYFPWMTRYFADMLASSAQLARVMKPTGTIGLVVQDSYYKEVHIDLQKSVSEIFLGLGWRLRSRHDFKVTHLKSSIHSVARRYLQERIATESLLLFRRK